MKKIGYIVIGSIIFIAGCTGNAYQLSTYEKEGQKGYHANQANKMIDANEKNRAANVKAAEKAKQQQNEHLNALNKNKTQNKNRTFNFY